MLNDSKTYNEYFEERRKEISDHAIEQYRKEGKLNGEALLRESNALDGELNKRLLEERLSQYNTRPH